MSTFERTGASTPRRPLEQGFVEQFLAVAERFAIAVASTDLVAPVPACGRWSTYDLIVHLGNIHAWAATILATGNQAAMQNDEPRTRDPVELSKWYAGKAEDLYEVLRSTDLDSPCWNFARAEPQARFWVRRQLHETIMHLVDLDQAAGRTTDLSATLSADGIDEVLSSFVPVMHSRGRLPELQAALTFYADDLEREWTLCPVENGPPALVLGSDPALGTDPGRGADPALGADLLAGQTVELSPPDEPVAHASDLLVDADLLDDAADLLAAPPTEASSVRVADLRDCAEHLMTEVDVVSGPAAALWLLLWKRTARSKVDGSRLLTHPEVTFAGDSDRITSFLAGRLTP